MKWKIWIVGNQESEMIIEAESFDDALEIARKTDVEDTAGQVYEEKEPV